MFQAGIVVMKETFFMDFPVGEFAKNYVDCMLKDIIKLENKEKFSSRDINKIDRLVKSLRIIDEPTVRRHIEQRLANILVIAAKAPDPRRDANETNHWAAITEHLAAILSKGQEDD